MNYLKIEVMKNKIFYLLVFISIGYFTNCCQKLDIPPINILTSDQVFSNESAITAYMVSLYNAIPWEDFDYFGYTGQLCNHTDEAISSVEGQRNRTGILNGTETQWWGYSNVRNVNDFIEKITNSVISEEVKNKLLGEALFLRAYYYFSMVKRYGGIPIIKNVQNFTGDNLTELHVPRDKEMDVYDFIASDLDEATRLLPESNIKGRVSKFGALAFKSRVMLYAGSSAKYGMVQIDGIVGIPASEATRYWQAAYDAADAVITSGKYSLYQKNPNKEDNFQQLFLDEDNPEAILTKYFSYPSKGHGFDVWALPFGVRSPQGYGSAINPTLELVEQFEYIDGTPGTLKIGTPSEPVFYEHPTDLFANKDPRLLATVIVPFSDWRGTTIDVQAGIYDQGIKTEAGDFSALYNIVTHQPDPNGTLHIVGINGFGGSEKTQTGFYVRKSLNSNIEQGLAKTTSMTQPWMGLRYAEVLLNYAEAAVELGKITDAKDKVNLVRSRAGIVSLDDSDINIEKVRHERLVELAFESHRWWDYRRWHVSDVLFNNTWVTALKPYYDVQADAYRFEKVITGYWAKTFDVKVYLERIDPAELAKNPNLVQNPLY